MKVTLGPYPDDDKAEREISVEIDEWDTWNVDDTIAYIIHPLLVKFAESEIATPPDFTIDEWKCVLQKMITSFEMIKENDSFFPKEDADKIKEGLNLFAQYYFLLWI